MFLALALLARGHGIRWRRDSKPRPEHRPGWVLAGWLVATWQLCIGFGVGLPYVYVLLGCMIVGVAVWFARRRPLPSPWLLLANGAGGLIFASTAALLAGPYLKVLELYPYARDRGPIDLYRRR